MTRPRIFAPVIVAVVMLSTMASAAPAARSSAGGAWQPGDPRYAVHTVRDVAFPMSDGVVLYGDLSYPADLETGRRVDGEFPVLLSVNPYDVGGLASVDAAALDAGLDYYVGYGYLGVVVDARGTGRSGGVDEFLSPRAQRDGAELIQHVAHALDGSNGDVGLIGCSYLGEWTLFNAANADAAGPSPVKAAVPQCASGVFFREFFNVGGLMTTDWYAGEAIFAAADASPLSPQPATTLTNVPDHAEGLYRHFLASTSNTLLGGDRSYEGKWWRDRSPLYRAHDIVRNRIPTLLISSYNDIFPQGALEMFTALQNLERGRYAYGPLSPASKPLSPRHQIVMGPGAHATGISAQISLQWFEEWLKGKRTGLAQTSTPIHLWRNGAEGWFDTDRYPVAASYTPLYLDEEGALAHTTPAADGSDTLPWAPAEAGGLLEYDTPPLERAATLAGPSTATIYATSTRPDVQLLAHLSTVAPDGTVTQLTKVGALVGSQRATRAKRNWVDADGRMVRPYHPLQEGSEEPVPTGEVVRLDVEIPPTVHDVPAGHRLRLTLRSQDFAPEGAVGPYPGLVPTLPQLANLVGGTYTIERSAGLSSVLNVPLLDAGSKVLRASPTDWTPEVSP